MPSAARLKFPGGQTPEQVAEAIRQRVASDPSGSLKEAERAFRTARDEKTQANAHRSRARAEMFRAEEFRRNLEAMGVEVIFEPGPEERSHQQHQRPGGASEHSSRSPDSI